MTVMDAAPVAQLVAHAQHAAQVRELAAAQARELAAAAEHRRPGRQDHQEAPQGHAAQ